MLIWYTKKGTHFLLESIVTHKYRNAKIIIRGTANASYANLLKEIIYRNDIKNIVDYKLEYASLIDLSPKNGSTFKERGSVTIFTGEAGKTIHC